MVGGMESLSKWIIYLAFKKVYVCGSWTRFLTSPSEWWVDKRSFQRSSDLKNKKWTVQQVLVEEKRSHHVHAVGKLDSQFIFQQLLMLHVGGRTIFIIHYYTSSLLKNGFLRGSLSFADECKQNSTKLVKYMLNTLKLVSVDALRWWTVWTVRVESIWLDRYGKVIQTATNKIIFVYRVIDHFNWVTTVMAPYTYTLECIW